MNTNCLEDISCPKCGQEDSFEMEVIGVIEGTTQKSRCWVRMFDDGIGGNILFDGDTEWPKDQKLVCPECKHTWERKDSYDNSTWSIDLLYDVTLNSESGNPVQENEPWQSFEARSVLDAAETVADFITPSDYKVEANKIGACDESLTLVFGGVTLNVKVDKSGSNDNGMSRQEFLKRLATALKAQGCR